MTGQEIIDRFELYVDDGTELSTSEELDLLNKIYRQILNSRLWEFLKKEFSTITTGLNYVTLPADFAYFIANGNYTENNVEYQGNQAPKIILVGNTEYKLVNWSDRRKYLNSSGYAYVDLANNRLYFSDTPASGQMVSADYIYRPADITTTTSPIFPEDFHPAIYHGMASEDYIIQQFDKARSYSAENKERFNNYLANMAYWNAQLLNN